MCKSILGEFLSSVSCMGMKIGLGREGKRSYFFFFLPHACCGSYTLYVSHFIGLISLNPQTIPVGMGVITSISNS